MMPTLHQIDKERCLIRLGRCLPTSVRENKAVPHAPTSPYSFGVRKAFPDIHSSYDSFSRSFTSL